MKFSELLQIVGTEPVFETGLLLAGDVDPGDVRRQLSRWTAAGYLCQVRRGLYALAKPYRKAEPHPFLVAGLLVRASYVSLQSALAYYGLIPEHVPITTSVTAKRPGNWDTPLGVFSFRRIKAGFFRGYRSIQVAPGQSAFLATPEKALLDLVYLHPDGDSPDYIAELRLGNLGQLDAVELRRLAEIGARPKLRRAADQIVSLMQIEAEEYVTL